MKTYQGSCHCTIVVFEVDTDLEALGVCNCSICRRRNAVMLRVPAERFRFLAGEKALTLYQFNAKSAKHYFCHHCGIYPFHRPRLAPDAYAVNVFCLGGLDAEDIAALPVRRFDGHSFSNVE